MVQPYPSAGPPPGPPARPDPPSSVVMAVRFMYAGAAISAIGLILDLFTLGSIRTNLHKTYPKLTPTQLHDAQQTFVIALIVTGLIGIGLWVWLAMMNKAGKSWARIVGSALFGIDTLLLLLGLSRAGAAAGTLSSILTWLLGLGAVVFLWRRDSSEFFTAASNPHGKA